MSTFLRSSRYASRSACRPRLSFVRRSPRPPSVGVILNGLLLLLGNLLLGASVQAQRLTYPTPGLYTLPIPAPISVTLTTKGGDGGNTVFGNGSIGRGGSGARMVLTSALQANDQLISIVGQSGRGGPSSSGSGGGGTAIVIRRSNTPTLLMASGGGGGNGNFAGDGGQGLGSSAGGAGGLNPTSNGGGGGGGGLAGSGEDGAIILPGPGNRPGFFNSGGGGGQASLTSISDGASIGFGGGGGGSRNANGGGGGGGGGYGGGNGAGPGGGQGGYSFGAGTITAGTTGGGQEQDGYVNLEFPTSSATAAITSANTSVCAGQSARITGSVTANGPWTLLLSDGTMVTGTGSIFSVSVTPTSATAYSIKFLLNGQGAALPGNLTGSQMVTINPPLVFTQQPASATGCVGSSVSIPFSVSGTGGSTFQLYRGSVAVGGVRSGSTLTFANLQPSDAGSYQVAVTGTCNSVTSVAFQLTLTAPTPEAQVLSDLYNATNGANWTRKDNWLTGCTPCNWYGVTCTNGRVTGLNLIGNNLAGTLPASLSALTSLQSLELGANALSGGIPTGIGSLTALQTLNLSRTQLGGSIPTSLGQLTSLQNLLLNESGLTGSLPGSLGGLTQLQNLQLYANQLGGCFPGSYTALCGKNVSFVNNAGLPGGGDFAAFCRDGSGGELAVSQYPQSGTACVGSAFSFSVVARGAGSYQWYKLGPQPGQFQQLAETGPVLRLASVSSADAGSYQVVINYGCGTGAIQSDAVTLSVPSNEASLLSSGNLSCTNSSVTLTAGGPAADAGVSFRFSDGATQISGGNTATVSTAGTYSVTIVSASGCSATASTTVTSDQAPPSISIDPSSATLSCGSPSATLTVVGTGSVLWSTGSRDPQITVSTGGTYSVTLTGGSGCSATASAVVTSDQAAPTVSISPTSGTLTCGSPTVTLTANTSAPTLRWSNGQTSTSITVDAAGTYSVTATGANNCSAVSNPVLIESSQSAPSATLLASGELNCTVSSVTLTANTGPGLSYRFSTGATQVGSGNAATVNTPGIYSVTVLSGNGCSSVVSTTVTGDQSVPTVSINPSSATLTCANSSATLTAIGTGSVLWNTGAQTATITATTAGTYSVTLRGSNGCTATASAVITSEQTAPAAFINPSSATLTCTNSSVTLTATGSGAVRWNTGQTMSSISVTTAGTYSVSVTSAGSCVAMASAVVISDQTAPSVSISPTSGTLTCANPSLTLTANTTAPTLRWSNGQTTPSITLNTAGTYSVTATGSNGCSTVSNSVLIESSQSVPSATLVASGTLSCSMTNVTLTAGTGSGLSYRFSSGATQLGTGNTATVNVAGTYSVTVINTATGCTSTASTVVNQDNSQPTVSIDPTTATLTCAVPSVLLTANTAANSLTWSTGETTTSISVSVAGTYSVSVTSSNGCMAMSQATVSGTTTAPVAPTLSASPATTTTNQPITVTASGCSGGTINWMALGGSGQVSGNTYTLSQPGNYTVSATCSLNGCTSVASAPLSVQIRPGGFAITGVNMVNCQLIDEAKGGYQVQFTPQYAGQNGNQISFAVVNELAATMAPAPYSLRLYTDNPVIILVATQAGNSEARFAYNWLASCQSGTSPNQPPTTTGIPSQTIVQGQGYQLQLTTYFSDPDGQALSFQASGLPAGLTLNGSVISGTPSQTGISTVNVTALDPGGLPVSTSFSLTVNPQPVSPPTGFAITGVSTVSCQVISAGERRLTFTPQYDGVSGDPISFSVVNELVATTNPGPYSLNLYTDNPTITLSAQQGATVSTYRYNWLAVCTPAARVGSGEAGSHLTVRVLGNPVEGNTAEVEISGAAGQPVQLNLVDLQGKSVHTQRIEQAGAVERVSLPLGTSKGVLFLQVSTPIQHQQVKLLRMN